MSDIRCKCDACDATFVVMDDFAGKKVRCPKCGNINHAPAASSDNDDVASDNKTAFSSPATSTHTNSPVSIPDTFLSALDNGGDNSPVMFDFSATSVSNSAPVVSGSSAVESSSVPSLASRSKQSEGSPLMVFVAGGGAILLLLLFVVAIVGTLPQEKQRQAEQVAKQKKLTLFVLNWSGSVDAQLLIDGEPKELPTEETQKDYPLTSGTHQVVIQRRGYQPIHLDLELERGQSFEFTPEWTPAAVDTIAALVPMAENIPSASRAMGGDGTAMLSNPATQWSPPQLSDVDLSTRAGKMEAALFRHLLINRQLVEITATIKDNSTLDAASVLIPTMEEELKQLVEQGNDLGPIEDYNQLTQLRQKYTPYVRETAMMIPYTAMPNRQLAVKWHQKLQAIAQLMESYRGPSFFQADEQPQVSRASR